MSKIALSGDASGTGTFTIASPNSNSNFTLTLPAESGTVLTTGSTTGISASALTTGTIPKARMFAGAVLQVVQATPAATAVSAAATGNNNPSLTTANTTLAFSASITPSSASNKILVQFVSSVDGSTVSNEEWVALFRGTTLLETSNWYRRVSNLEPLKHALIYLDSPSSTSAVQYDFRCAGTAATTLCFNRDTANGGGTAWACNTNVILMEIAG